MVKPTKNRLSHNGSSSPNVVVGSTKRDGVALALMRPALIEVADILTEKPAQVFFTQEQGVIETFTACGAISGTT